MTTTTLDLLQGALRDPFAALAARHLGMDEAQFAQTQQAVLPALLQRLAHDGSTLDGTNRLLQLFNTPGLPHADEAAALLTPEHAPRLQALGQTLLQTLSGAGEFLPLPDTLPASAQRDVLALTIPFVLGQLKQPLGRDEVNAADLPRLLPPLPITPPAAASTATDTAAAGTTPPAAGKRWRHALWLLVVLLLGILLLRNCQSVPDTPLPPPVPPAPQATEGNTAPAAAPAAAAPASLPAPVSLYYDRNVTRAPDDSNTLLADVIAYLRAHPDARVEIRGYHDQLGPLTHNRALAAGRAEGIRVLLLQADIAPSQIVEQVPADTVGDPLDDKKARRVDVTVGP